MYLSRLEIFGFKTFAQKTDIRFDDGITNIVGPNGCGKTNIVDAIRWVIGEQKSKTLRSDKMENFIFNGAKERKPMGMAEVSLTIENNRAILPVEYTTVTLTRRLYRSGESEYYINRMACRLKDINDLFMDTGMGAHAYSVIELKMVEQILSENAEDRRRLFEEAAGVTKYKIRRRQTYRKLDATRNDLLRVNDIIGEVEKNVASLRLQTKRAKRYKRLVIELKKREVRMAQFDYNRLVEKIRPINEKLRNLENTANELSGNASRKEAEVESLNVRLIEREQELRTAESTLETHNREISEFQEKILVSRERIKSLEDNIQRFNSERESLKQRAEVLKERISEYEDKIKELRETEQQLRSELAGKKQDLEAFDNDFVLKKSGHEQIRKQLIETMDQLSEARKRFELAAQNLEGIAGKIAELRRENDEHRRLQEEARGILEQLNGQRSGLEQNIAETKSRHETLKSESSALNEALQNLRQRRADAESDIKALRSRIAFTQKAIESYEGFPESVRYVVNRQHGGIRGTLADIIVTEEKYKPALETALGEAFSYLLADNRNVISEIAGALKSDQKGKAVFLDLDRVSPNGKMREQLEPRRSDILGFAIDFLQTDDRQKHVFDMLIGDCAFVDSFDRAESMSSEFPEFRFITLDGEMVRGGALMRTGGSEGEKASLIGQRQTLKDFENELKNRESDLGSINWEINSKEGEFGGKQTAIKEIEETLNGLQSRHAELDKKVSQKEYELGHTSELLKKNEDEITRLATDSSGAAESKDALTPELETLEAKRRELEAQSDESGSVLENLERTRGEKIEEINDLNTTVVRLEGDVRNTEREIENFKEQITGIEQTIERRIEETEQAGKEIEELKAINVEKEKIMAQLFEKKEALVQGRDAAANEHQDVRGQVTKIEEALRKIRREKDELLDSRHHMEMEVSEMVYELKSLRSGIKKSYDVDLRTYRFDQEAEEQRFSKRQHARQVEEDDDDDDNGSKGGSADASAAVFTSGVREAGMAGDLTRGDEEPNGTPDHVSQEETVEPAVDSEEAIAGETQEQEESDGDTESEEPEQIQLPYHEPTIEELLRTIEDPIAFEQEVVSEEFLEEERTEIEKIQSRIRALEPVNIFAIEEYETEKERLDFLTQQRQDLLDAEEQLIQTIQKINETAQTQFTDTFALIRENFVKIFTGLFEGGEADLKLELDGEKDPLEANIQILARPKGKKIQHITLLSGGEKTLTAIALLFAIYLVKPSPFCILDEIDAPLDDVNIDKFTRLLQEFSKNTQFIIITHNKRTMESARNIYGVSMQEEGVSKVISIRMEEKEELERHGVV